MRLFELSKLPKEAGEAKVTWRREKEDRWDYADLSRKGVHLTLVDSFSAEFFPLLGGKQFVYGLNGRWYFGGTDENPFMVQLQNFTFDAFGRTNFEKNFIDWLKPDKVKNLEKKWGTTAIRQGDWFAVKSPHDTAKIAEALSVLYGLDESDKSKEANDMTLGGTRHRFTGMIVSIPNTRSHLYSGVLTAPDHKPRDLSDGLYSLIQCDKLFDQKRAD